jgi:adenine deaminase
MQETADGSCVSESRGGADLLLANARILDVFSGEFWLGDVALSRGRIVGFGAVNASDVRDLEGRWLIPGLIDAHVHIESSQLAPSEFVRAVLPLGTTAVISDPHEIANVCGLDGVRYMLQATEGVPFHAFMTAPSCVPASPFETPWAVLGRDDVAAMLGWDRVVGLGEMMDFSGVVRGETDVIAKLNAAKGVPIDGHAPGLTGPDLWAYVCRGPRTDHECTTLQEGREKLRAGMHILIREGTATRDLGALLPLLTDRTAPFVHFCTDDRHPETLVRDGHMDDLVRQAIAGGVPAEVAIAAATIHTARAYGLNDLGAVAPGYCADLLVLSDLRTFQVSEVFVGGTSVAVNGVCTVDIPLGFDEGMRDTVRVDLDRLSFLIPWEDRTSEEVRVIRVTPGRLLTDEVRLVPLVSNEEVVVDLARDVLKLAVIERHRSTGNVALGLVQGFGLRGGALASSVAHDAHNIVVVGTTDQDMHIAVQELVRMGGGQVVVSGGDVTAVLRLPIAGLMSDLPLNDVASVARELRRAASRMGCSLPTPFATLSFLALPVIPHLKLTDRGLVDVDRSLLVALFV